MAESTAVASETARKYKSLVRALHLLSYFTEHSPEWSVSELARHAKMPKSTVSTILATLREEDLLYQQPDTGRYRLGLRCLELGYYSASQLVIRDIAFPYLQSLLESVNQIVYMAVPYQSQVLYIEALYPLARRVNYSSVGRRAPMYCTAIGKALLAHMPDKERNAFLSGTELVAFTPNTLTDVKALEEELARTRTRGYAIDQEEREPGIRCVAAPLYGRKNTTVAAVSISGPANEFTPERVAEYGLRLKNLSNELSRKLALAGF